MEKQVYVGITGLAFRTIVSTHNKCLNINPWIWNGVRDYTYSRKNKIKIIFNKRKV